MANIGYPLENVYITNWKITMLLMGKLTISMAMFNSYVTNYQRVIASPTQWIGLRENLNRKPWILPSNLMGFPVKIFPSSNSMTNWLVVEPYPSEKSDFVSWMMTFPIYGKIIHMFQSINQIWNIPPIWVPNMCKCHMKNHGFLMVSWGCLTKRGKRALRSHP